MVVAVGVDGGGCSLDRGREALLGIAVEEVFVWFVGLWSAELRFVAVDLPVELIVVLIVLVESVAFVVVDSYPSLLT